MQSRGTKLAQVDPRSAPAVATAVNPSGRHNDDIAKVGEPLDRFAAKQPARSEIGKEGRGAPEISALQIRPCLLGYVEVADQAHHRHAPAHPSS